MKDYWSVGARWGTHGPDGGWGAGDGVIKLGKLIISKHSLGTVWHETT